MATVIPTHNGSAPSAIADPRSPATTCRAPVVEPLTLRIGFVEVGTEVSIASILRGQLPVVPEKLNFAFLIFLLATTEPSAGAVLMRFKSANGIPLEMVSCHTARVEGYLIEGHVPAADIRRLLAERPDAVGLAVPGMPFGSPGMGPENSREAHDVFLIRSDGTKRVFRSYEAA